MRRTKFFPIKGFYRDRLYHKCGRIRDFGWKPNIIVTSCRSLIAAFFKGAVTTGITCLKVGKGEESWDLTPPGAPELSQLALTDPAPVDIPVPLENIQYLDPGGDTVTEPRPRLRITIVLEQGVPSLEGELSYPLREFGLFGTIGVEQYMIDYVRHQVLFKEPEDVLERTIELVF